MSKYDLIAFDMDGTLLDSQKRIRPDSLKMIDKATKAGKIVCLSTGRCLPELKDYEQALSSMPYFICISGALIYDNINNSILSSTSIPDKTARQLFERVKTKDLMIHILSDQSIINKKKIEEMPLYQMGNYQQAFKKITRQVDDVIDSWQNENFPLYKINLYSKSPEKREQLLPQISDIDLTFTYSEITSIECTAKGLSKATGLKQLCQKLHIPLERTIAVGDADNDLEILKTAGLAIAMGNANQNIKNIADVIVKSNDDEGCAQAISNFLLPSS